MLVRAPDVRANDQDPEGRQLRVRFARNDPGLLGILSHTYAAGPEPLTVFDVDITVTEAGGAATGSGQLSVDVTT